MSDRTPTPAAWSRPGGAWGSGTVTAPGVPPAAPPPAPPEPSAADGPQRRRRQMLVFGAVAGAILVVGLVVLLIAGLSSASNPFGGKAAGPADLRPPLAQMCPAPTVAPSADPTGRPGAPPEV